MYFQVANPKPLLRDADSHYKTLREFCGAQSFDEAVHRPSAVVTSHSICRTT
jgi:hypothetical protein